MTIARLLLARLHLAAARYLIRRSLVYARAAGVEVGTPPRVGSAT
ncbi:hypothetical protein HNR47_002975 [Methylopila jiangsuensis]|nr:hypothetical protein [Methylopila jiangsuensis]